MVFIALAMLAIGLISKALPKREDEPDWLVEERYERYRAGFGR